MNAASYEHNGRPIGRDAFYAIACDPRRSVAVEACAGAGKTWMLVSRIVRALLEGTAGGPGSARVQPHEILAITFTKKAAGEMRQRLQAWLAEFAQAAPEQLEKELVSRGIEPKSASAGREALQNLYQTLLDGGRPVQIRTFHSWFAALLRTAPMATLQHLGLPTAYELLEDDEPAMDEVWRPFLRGVAADASLRADFEALVQEHGRAQALKALEAALRKRVEFALADDAGVVDTSVAAFGKRFPELADLAHPQDWLRDRPLATTQLLDAARALGQANAPTFSAKGVELEAAVGQRDWSGVVGALMTDKGTPRKFGEKIVGIERVREAQAAVERVADALRQHAAWQHQQRMARLTRRLLADYAALKRAQGWIDMNDVERAALVLLSDPVLSGWVQERLDARVRHLLIDEFQDTNPLQWQALYAWISGYAGAGQAPSVFIVGDPKQSIYRFRRAEPQVFRAAKDFVRDGLGGDLLSCDHTRRNATGIVSAVNRVLLAAQDAGGYAGFRAHSTESAEAGEVLALPPIARAEKHAEDAPDPLAWRDSLTTPRAEAEDTLRTLECRQAARWIAAQVAGGLPPEEVMVLARKRDALAPLQQELRALGIATEQPEKTDLADAAEVQDVVALIDALVSPTHDLSLARALKSPLFGLTDDDLIALAQARRQAGDAAVSWFDLLQKNELESDNWRGLAADLAQYQQWLAGLPPHDALQAIYDHRSVLARYAVAAPPPQRERVLANLRALLGAALQQGGGRYLTPYAFVRALRKGRIKPPSRANAQAVRLLTVHGAKGLEADAVLLLDTDTTPPRAETMGVLVQWPGESPAPVCFIFLASEKAPPASAVAALAEEQAERQREELNALYVAMTRAKTRLVISSITPRHANANSWRERMAPHATAIDAPAELPEGSAAVAGPFFMLNMPEVPVDRSSLAINNVAIDGTSSDGADVPGDTLASRLGQAMHSLLEHAGETATGWSAARLAQLARELAITPAQAASAADAARRILTGEGAWAWDTAVVDWARDEVELVWRGQTLRIDRLVRRRDTGQWWVLDHKTAEAPERQPALRAQMRQYRDAVQALEPGAVVRSAFLTAAGALVEAP